MWHNWQNFKTILSEMYDKSNSIERHNISYLFFLTDKNIAMISSEKHTMTC